MAQRRPQRVPSRQRLEARGEAQAAAWYEAQGYEVVARNWRCRDGEIDLVCRRRGVLAIVEVWLMRKLILKGPEHLAAPAPDTPSPQPALAG